MAVRVAAEASETRAVLVSQVRDLTVATLAGCWLLEAVVAVLLRLARMWAQMCRMLATEAMVLRHLSLARPLCTPEVEEEVVEVLPTPMALAALAVVATVAHRAAMALMDLAAAAGAARLPAHLLQAEMAVTASSS